MTALEAAAPASMARGRADKALPVIETLSAHLRYARAERELSYREAADQIGISYSTMWALESGRQVGNMVTVLRCLRWLVDGEDWA